MILRLTFYFANFASHKSRWFCEISTFASGKSRWFEKKSVTILRLLLAINRDDCSFLRLLLAINRDDLDTFFANPLLRIATPGLRPQSGRKSLFWRYGKVAIYWKSKMCPTYQIEKFDQAYFSLKIFSSIYMSNDLQTFFHGLPGTQRC